MTQDLNEDMNETFRDNGQAGRYELHVGNDVAFANYRHEGTTLYIDYVESPVVLRGTGAAGRLMQHIMESVRDGSVEKVVPICGYAVSWLQRHPEYKDLTSL